MLTIENVQRLKGKVIGQTGYYVESIKPVDMNIVVDKINKLILEQYVS